MGSYLAGTAVTITETFYVGDVATDPTTVTFTVENPDLTTDTYVFGVDGEVSNPSDGVYKLNLPAQTQIGTYHYAVTGTGAVVASSQGDFTIYALASQPGEAQIGPCSPWVDASDVADCAGITLSSSNNDALAAQAVSASQILFELSGRIFPGICSQVVRPCDPACGCNWQMLSRGYVIWWGDNWGCEYGGCGCKPLSRVKLAGHATAIVEVKIDGAILAESEYRLDENRWLTRTGGGRWPGCQNLALADTEDGTFSVEYLYGQQPPLVAQQAAASLASELYKACFGSEGECKLPSKARRVIRQGVTIDMIPALASMLQRGETGLPAIDSFIAAFNRSNLMRRPTFWSPSRRDRYARRVG